MFTRRGRRTRKQRGTSTEASTRAAVVDLGIFQERDPTTALWTLHDGRTTIDTAAAGRQQ